MLIVTENGEAINAHHIVRFFLQTDGDIQNENEPARWKVVLHLTNRQKIVAAVVQDEPKARMLFRDVVRQWVRGQAIIEITACLKRIEKGEPDGNGRSEVCL